jgi:hypothetical protein
MAAERRVTPANGRQVDTRPDVEVARRAARQWGVVSAGELRHCGLSSKAVSRRVSKGWLHPIHRGIYAVGHDNPPLEGRLLAAVKACGSGALLSHFAAAAHLGLVRWDGRRPEVTVAGPGVRCRPGIRVHRSAFLDSADITEHRAIPITSPARTLVDLASVLDRRSLRRAVRQAQSLRLVELRQVMEVLARLGPRRGITKLANIIATGPAPTGSELEDVVLDLLLAGGLEHPDVNVPLVVEGREVIPDFRWPTKQLIVEADGAAWHDNKLSKEADAERQALLEAHGERIVRVTWGQAISEPRQTLARIEAAGAPGDGRASS